MNPPRSVFSRHNIRLSILAGLLVLPVIAIGWKLFSIQVLRGKEFQAKATAQQLRQFEIPAKRGEIFLEDNGELYPIALNNRLKYLYADPKLIPDPEKAAQELAPIINADAGKLKNDLTYKESINNRYIELKQQVSKADAQKISDLKIRGLVLKDRDYRSYPEGNLFSHVLGYVNADNKGQYGVEEYLDQDRPNIAGISGENGMLKAITDSQGTPISTQDNIIKEPRNGTSYILTIDRYIQNIAQAAIAKAVKDNQAESGSMIVMDPYSGAIKAMVNVPDYDPNNYGAVKSDNYRSFINSAITNQFEPGSGFKPLTMSIGIESGKITPATSFTDPGSVKIGEYTITNAEQKTFGTVDMSLIIKNSINTGMVYILRVLGGNPSQITRAGKDILHDGIMKFGFGKKTGIELAGEASGRVKDASAADIDYANMTFGQGIATTSIQMISAIASIANGGALVTPHVLAKSIKPNGEIISVPHEPRNKQVISEKTASDVASMMIKVVEGGSGYLTRMPGYKIAGKTGTAQVPKPGGGYEEDKNIGSFIGFAPVDNPRFIIMVRVDYPKTKTFAERSAVPAFAEVTKQLFSYYQVPPSTQ
ncbi:penicillin-binding protein 2 [Candidatus Saccharibacteria bacterium]|nr:penicillin-binding protein 2 [Candidatus Saccharibacteria bacterium]